MNDQRRLEGTDEKTTLAGFEPARENPIDFKSIALTTRPQCLDTNDDFELYFFAFY